MIGYTQYFTHLPSLLVGIHVVGATVAVFSTALWFHHGLSDHRPEAVDDGHRRSGAGVVSGVTEPVREPA